MTQEKAGPHYGIVTTIGGAVRVDDLYDDAPIATFHQGRYEAMRAARLLLEALTAANAYRSEDTMRSGPKID